MSFKERLGSEDLKESQGTELKNTRIFMGSPQTTLRRLHLAANKYFPSSFYNANLHISHPYFFLMKKERSISESQIRAHITENYSQGGRLIGLPAFTLGYANRYFGSRIHWMTPIHVNMKPT